MADLSVTAANVGIASSATQVKVVQVGEAVTQGQPGYRETTGKYHRGDANAAGKFNVEGIFMTAANTDGFALLATRGLVNLGATLAAGTVYVLSDTVGGIKPVADLDPADNVVILGAATTTALLNLNIQVTTAVVPTP